MKKILALILILVAAAYLVACITVSHYYKGRDLALEFRPIYGGVFETVIWRSPTDNQERFVMVDDLLRRHVALGMPRKELLDLLGAPDTPAKDFNTGANEYIYVIGSQKKYPPVSVFVPKTWFGYRDHWLLVFKFDGERLVGARITYS